ncbi:glycoside hydrolase N-terminal domain-containing protein [Mucilaginibacter sp. AW1-3]
MKKLSLIVISILFAGSASAQSDNLKLWYNKPAEKWTDALPIGNGRLGAMIYGGVNSDHIQFNEQTLWSGGPRTYQRVGAASYLPKIRELLFEGKQAEAEKLAGEHFMGMKSNEATYPSQFAGWLKKVKADIALATQDESKWPEIKVPTPNGWEVAGLPGVDGAVWFRNSFELPKGWKGKNLVINLGKIRDMDITYINGVEVGSMDSMNFGRIYTIAASLLKEGKNEVAIQVINPYDKGGLVGPKADQKPYVVYPEGEDPKNGIVLSPNWKYKIQDADPPAAPAYEADYQPFGDLYLNFKKTEAVTDYHRELDIKNAVSTTSYTSNGVHFIREYFASEPDQAIVIHIKANKAGQVNLDALLQTFQKKNHIAKIDDHTIAMTLTVNNGVLHAASYLFAKAVNGKISVSDKGVSVNNADEVTFYLIAATSFKNYQNVTGDPKAICTQQLANVRSKTYATIKAAHIADYQKYFNTFSVNFGGDGAVSLPTDERIKQFSTTFDPGLLSLYMQYARYLMISCSRPNSPLPANLQGIWNDQLTPPWGSKYTTNINLQMNYWPVDELNLADCGKPLYKMISELSVAGKATAKVYYDAPGWVLHHNTDIWLGTAPINASNHGIWQPGGAWLCHNLYEHYLFTKDKTFLQTAYPEMKGAAEFFVSTLVKDPKTGYLISTPSNSPEHGGLVAGPTMDRQIIRDLFKNCIAASKTLGIDADFRKKLEEKYKQVAPNMIGKYGQLQEWMEDKDDTSDTHRHVSHLWGVYPGTDITWDASPAMMHAAEQSFKYRGDDATGWSLAWKINLMARFKHADHAMLLVNKLLSVAENDNGKDRSGVYHNLFDAHPPFQIDGNFGGAAGIAEMLVQSQQGYIELLPTLPGALPDGEVKGLCARGGFVMNIKWQNGKLQRLEITSKAGSDCELKYAGLSTKFKTVKGKTYVFNGSLKGV